VRRYLPKVLGRDVRLKLEIKLVLLLFAALLMSRDADLTFAQNEAAQAGSATSATEVDGRDLFIATGEGLIEVTANRVAILTDLAIPADRIDEAKAEEARQRAEARLREKLSDEEHASVNALLSRSLAQLRVKRRRRV
jgi:ATP synthase delta/epsilon subunit-like protein